MATMSATLRPCSIGGLTSSSGLLLTSRPPRSSTLSLPLARGLGGRNNLKLVNPKTRHGHGIVNGAADGRQVVVDREDPAEMEYEYFEEQDKIKEFFMKIPSSGILYRETAGFRCYLCKIAADSVGLVSTIMGKPSVIPQDALLTTLIAPTKREKLVLQVHLRTFVSTAEAAYHDKVTEETIVSFLGALEGEAAMSYFMARDTLAKYSDDISISPNCGRNIILDITRRKYTIKIDILKHEFNTASPFDGMNILRDTVTKAIVDTESFVTSMTVCRRKVLRGLTQATQRREQFDGKPGFGEPVFWKQWNINQMSHS
ncbi:unnamed protein product [Alopecurus aequalis]